MTWPAPLIAVAPVVARHAFALLALEHDAAPVRLDDVTLRPHQVDAVERLRAALRANGGVLLADAVGLGKTYVALALAREYGGALVVAPAALRGMWRDAIERTQVAGVDFVSFETLSRGWSPPQCPPLLLVDEAHHVRTAQTRRHRELAAIAAQGTAVLLLSATPIHNRASDLATMLSLFLGARALRMPLAALQQHVVRRTPRDLDAPPPVPRVAAPRALALPADDDLLDAIAAIPPAVPPSDGGTAHALCTLGLLRAWASSDAALVVALRRRLATARALQAAFDEGHYPSRQALSAWTVGDDAVQLAFPSLVAAPAAPGTPIETLREAVAAHADALRELLARTSTSGVRDAARAAHLAALLVEPGARILAFSHSAQTVHALFRHLRTVPGVCALTGHGAEVVGGRLSRAEALARFAPHSAGAREPHPADAIRLLIATDLLSEGLNLQDASGVVHLDLPWTAARVEQRVGRVVRPGGRHARVDVYAMAPPASGAAALRVESRLRTKLDVASRAVGAPSIGALLSPVTTADAVPPSNVELSEQIRSVLRSWRDQIDGNGERVPGSLVATVTSGEGGWLAAVRHGGPFASTVLVADLGDGPTTSPATILRALRGASGGEAATSATETERCQTAVARWLAERVGAGFAGTDALSNPAVRQSALRRIAEIVGRAAAHHRAGVAARAAAAHAAVTSQPGARLDAELRALCELNDAEWLAAVASLGGRLIGHPEPGAVDEPLALVLLVFTADVSRHQNTTIY